MHTHTNAQRVADQLRREILDGRIAPGARLRAEAIADRYGVSRSPARESFLLLAREGLLEIQPRRGAVVRSFDERDLRELYEVRALLEPLAARRAAARITAGQVAQLEALCLEQEGLGSGEADVLHHIELNGRFHRTIVEVADSARLSAALSQVEGIPVSFRTRFWRDAPTRTQSLHCHRSVLDALRAGDGDLAWSAMRTHQLAAMRLVHP